MKNVSTLRAALMGSALAAPMILATAAQAQQQNQAGITQEQFANLLPGCQELVQVSDEVIADINTREDVARLAGANVEADCAIAVERFQQLQQEVQAAATEQERLELERAAFAEVDAEVAAVEVEEIEGSATLEIEREAIVEGEVVVTQEAADVDVSAAETEVEVTPQAPEVQVRELSPEIVVRQQQPTIRLAMPQPTISIEMPAPDIFVRMQNPEVAVASAQPEVEVRQGEPNVRVSVPEPQVNVDVQARIVDPNEVDPERVLAGAGMDEAAVARVEAATGEDAQIDITRSEPRVSVGQMEGEANIQITSAEPTIRYEPAEPRVEIQGQPQVEFRQVGEPNVTFETAEQAQQRMQREQEQQAALQLQPEEGQEQAGGMAMEIETETEEVETAAVGTTAEIEEEAEFTATEITEETRGLLVATDPELAAAQEGQIAVDELLGYDVVNARGEDLGEAERIVRNNGVLYLVVEHGGFLGIGGEEVALPMERVTLRGEQLVLEGLTEADLQAMPTYDRGTELEVERTEMVDLGVL